MRSLSSPTSSAAHFPHKTQLKQHGKGISTGDPGELSVIKSDLLQLQQRIDLFDFHEHKHILTYDMEQLEGLLIAMPADASEDGRCFLMEQLMVKVGQLCKQLVKVCSKATSNPKAQTSVTATESPLLLPPLFVSTTACTVDQSVDSSLTLPRPRPRPSFIADFLVVADKYAERKFGDYDPTNLEGQLTLAAEWRSELDATRKSCAQEMADLRKQHEDELAGRQASYQQELQNLQAALDDLHASRKAPPTEKMVRALNRELTAMTETNSRLQHEVDELVKVVQVTSESETEAFGQAPDLGWLCSILGLDCLLTSGGSLLETLAPQSQLSSSIEGIQSTQTKRRKAAEGDILVAQLSQKVQVYSGVLRKQCRLLHEVQAKVRGLVGRHEEQIDTLRSEVGFVQQRLQAAMEEREAAVARAQQMLQVEQQKSDLLEREIERMRSEEAALEREADEHARRLCTLPKVIHADHVPELPVMKRLRATNKALFWAEQQRTAVEAQLRDAVGELDRARQQAELLRSENERLRAAAAGASSAAQQVDRLAGQREAELEQLRGELTTAQRRLAQSAGANSQLHERAKALELQLAKAEALVGSLEGQAKAAERRFEEERTRQQREMADMMRVQNEAQQKLRDEADLCRRDAAAAADLAAGLQQLYAPLEALLRRRVGQAQGLLRSAALLLGAFTEALDPTTQRYDASSTLVEVGNTLADLRPASDPSWLESILKIQASKDWLAARRSSRSLTASPM